MPSPSVRVALLVTLLTAGPLSAACGGGSSGDDDDTPDADTTGMPDAAPSPSCLEAEDHSDLAWLQANVITPSCAAFSSCHMGTAASAGDLNLEDGMFEENTVNVPSDLEPTLDLVEPGAPEDSYLMVILGHYGAGDARIDADVGTMPYNLPILCKEKRDAIERWILAL